MRGWAGVGWVGVVDAECGGNAVAEWFCSPGGVAVRGGEVAAERWSEATPVAERWMGSEAARAANRRWIGTAAEGRRRIGVLVDERWTGVAEDELWIGAPVDAY